MGPDVGSVGTVPGSVVPAVGSVVVVPGVVVDESDDVGRVLSGTTLAVLVAVGSAPRDWPAVRPWS